MPATPTPSLYNLYIYTNEECNLACKHCWVTARLRKSVEGPVVPLEHYVDFIEQAIPLGLGFIKVSGGEALLRRDAVLGILEHAHRRSIPARLETNGTLIDDDLARDLAQMGCSVSISLDGSNAAVHEEMRRVKGCFDAAVEGIRRLRRHGIPVEVVFALYRGNEQDLDNVVELGAGLGAYRIKFNPIIASGRGKLMERRGECLSAPELWSAIRTLEKRYAGCRPAVAVNAEPAFHSLSYIAQGRVLGGRCGFLSLLGILASGDISYCGMGYQHSEYIFGKVGEIDLADVWPRHPTLQRVREGLPRRLEGVCGNCSLREHCQGACRSNAFDTYGALTAPSPGCQALYDSGLFPTSRLINPAADCSYSLTAREDRSASHSN